MTNFITNILEKLKYITDDDFNIKYKEDEEVLDENTEKELLDLFNSLIDEDNLNEMFVDKGAIKKHFLKHCLGKSKTKKSNKNTVFYDFKYENQYIDYEQELSKHYGDSDYIISNLDNPDLPKIFYKFFEGDKTILLTKSCGFKNGRNIFIHSFATNVTQNYKDNTIDFVVLAHGRNRAVTLYPIDSYYLETKLNNIIDKDSKILNFNKK